MSAIITTWDINVAYLVNQTVYTSTNPSVAKQYQNKIFRAISAHTSTSFATDFGNGLWEELTVKGIQGPAGPTGATGPQGPAGATGAAGANGGAGADGIFSTIASQATAEAGTDNTEGMSPLRVAQAIAAQVPGLSVITTLIADVAANLVSINNLKSRTTVLEATNLYLSRSTGKQRLQNNFGPQDILGADLPGEDGKGNRFELNTEGAKSARVHVEIYREDDAEIRFTTCVLLLHFIPGTNTWAIEREATTVMSGGPDGVTFDVTTSALGGGEFLATVNYTTDNMVGGNYRAGSYVKFLLQEIKDTF